MLRRPLASAALGASLSYIAIACGADTPEKGHWDGEPAPTRGAAVDAGGGAGPANDWPHGMPAPNSTGNDEAGAADSGVDADGAGSPVSPCGEKPGAAGEMPLTLHLGGQDRTMIVHVPTTYNPKVPASLVFNFHGFVNTAAQQRDISLMEATSDAHGFILVYPDGLGQSWNAGDCCGLAVTANVDDVGFVKAALATMSRDWCVDPKRIYATGFSNGGFLAHRLACEMSETFAAIAPVSGVLGRDPSTCNPTRPLSVLEFHGTSDQVVPYNGGVPFLGSDSGVQSTFRSVKETVDFWRAKNECQPGTQVYAKGDATCTRYACKAGTKVEFCSIDGGGHNWPGGGPVFGGGKISKDISASEQIWAFFEGVSL